MKKIITVLVAFMLLTTIIPTTKVLAQEGTIVDNETDLIAAINAIADGGSGEITIKDVILSTNGIYFENKTITFNLENADLSTSNGAPVFHVYNGSIIINADEESSLEVFDSISGGDGVIRVENEYNTVDSKYDDTNVLVLNGGKYFAPETEYGLSIFPGTEVTIHNAVFDSGFNFVDFSSVDIHEKGSLKINGGIFAEDLSEYVTANKYKELIKDKFYVREEEYSSDFLSVLENNAITFNYVTPKDEMDESLYLISEDFNMNHENFYLDPMDFNADFSKVILGLYEGSTKEEFHEVDVVWNYDTKTKEVAQSFIDKFPTDRDWFNVTDLELVNYWVYRDVNNEVDSLANYSGELKSYLNNMNFLFTVETRGGGDDPFYTERIGTAKLIRDGVVYYARDFVGARAEHVIYVSEDTAETKDALMQAAQKRIDDYIGEGIITISATNETVSSYYNKTIADYDAEIADAISRKAAAQAAYDAEYAKGNGNWDWNILTNAQWEMMECDNIIQNTPFYKQYFIDSFEDGGDLHFLNSAVNDYFFSVEVDGETYTFIIVKDNDKLVTPKHNSVDLNTNISVNTNSSSVPLDTMVEVDKLEDGKEYDHVMDVLDVKEEETYDIKLHSFSLDTYVEKLEDGSFEVRIPIPEKFKDKDLVVYYVDDKDKVHSYTVTPENGYATFKTDHFSIYTLTTKANSGVGTYDSTNVVSLLTMMIVSLGVLINRKED